jgi:hypothetical protein
MKFKFPFFFWIKSVSQRVAEWALDKTDMLADRMVFAFIFHSFLPYIVPEPQQPKKRGKNINQEEGLCQLSLNPTAITDCP